MGRGGGEWKDVRVILRASHDGAGSQNAHQTHARLCAKASGPLKERVHVS